MPNDHFEWRQSKYAALELNLKCAIPKDIEPVISNVIERVWQLRVIHVCRDIQRS